ncbi:alpha/beta hydrolase fold domain-containing protein [Parvularcula oceani]|uniref:alpha/beta hydrolase fold domain-containing protein n=1 Tax=Parvularcula oceani TaxID=1247963 RepID=UPI00068A1A7A|nr:alpha/beta hydrolase [Parvularcula oceani]
MTEEELEALIAAHPVKGDPGAMREGFAALAAAGSRMRAVPRKDVEIGGHRAIVLTPERATGRQVLHLHGGGYVFGSPRTHLAFAAALAEEAQAELVLPAYPLAPEALWPAQREAAAAIAESLGGEIVLSGDSAGGHLALSLALRGIKARGLALFSPNTARDYAESRSRQSTQDAMNEAGQDDALARLAFSAIRPEDPEQTLLLQDLSRLPPLHIDVGRREVLLDDSLRLARAAALAGVLTELCVRDGFHLIQLFAGRYPAADAAIARAGAWIRAL